MAEPIAKIVSIDTSKLAGAENAQRAELGFNVTIEHEGQTYRRTIAFVSEARVNTHATNPTDADVERVVLAEADKIKALHSLADSMASQVAVDLVARRES